MQDISDLALLKDLQSSSALFMLFGGPTCAVCKSLRPRISAMLAQHFPDMHGVYVDCEASPEICAQYRVFSLPVVKAYIEGMLVADEAGAFSIRQLIETIERPYSMWQAS